LKACFVVGGWLAIRKTEGRELQYSTVFPNLKSSTGAISLRLPVSLIDRLKMLANKQDVEVYSGGQGD